MMGQATGLIRVSGIPDNRLLFACIGLMPAAMYAGDSKYG